MKRILALAVVAIVAGCGGGSGAPPAPAPVVPASANRTQSGTLSVSFSTAGAATSAARRSPAFVSPNAATATIAVNGGTPQSFDVSATSTLCTTSGSTRTCALALNAPVGTDAFAVSLVSGGASPAILGQGSNSTTVVAGTPFSLTVGINPIIAALASFAITFPNAGHAFSYLTPQTATVTLTFADPSGAVITGSGNVPNFLVPIAFTSSDPHVTISPSSITTPGQSLTLSYDGSAAVAGTVTLNATLGSTTLAAGTVNVPGLQAIRYNLGAVGSGYTVEPLQITVGPDNKMWWTEELSNSIGTIAPGTASSAPGVQSVTHYPNTIGGAPVGITTGGDGNLWYSTDTATIGRMSTSGGAPSSGPASITVGATAQVGRLATDSQGNVWYVNAANGSLGYVDMTTFAVHPFAAAPTANALNDFSGITLGSDHAIWFTENRYSPAAQNIGRITTPANGTAGTYAEFPIANSSSLIYPTDIAAGPDGKVWFSEFDGNANAPNQFFANFTPGASIAINEFPNVINPAAFANLVTMFAGGDGNMWIAEGGGAVKIPPGTPTAAVTEFFTDNGQTSMNDCVKGPDGYNWCTVAGGPALGSGFIPTADGIVTFKPR